MFNQLTPAEVVTAVGTTLRAAARSDDRTSEFERDQLLSAYSATRHLAVELASFEHVLHAYAREVAARVRATPGAGEAPLAELAARLDGEVTPATAGAAVGDLLAVLRTADDPGSRDLLRDVRRLTRRLADDEVALLADGLGRRS